MTSKVYSVPFTFSQIYSTTILKEWECLYMKELSEENGMTFALAADILLCQKIFFNV